MSSVKSRHVQVLIDGKVQGVFFRASVRKKAQQLGVVGYAENLSNGRVKVMAAGPPTEIQQLLDWCQKGPTGAKVENVIVEDKLTNGHYVTFEIKG